MNIHIDYDEFKWLIGQPKIGKFTIGSELYDLNDKDSDKDYLIITYPFTNIVNSPFKNYHQFQYKDIENNIDYNFVDLITFVKNLVSGDSTVNFELLYSPEFQNNDYIGWLSDFKEKFRTYNIIKSYAGMAERDIKYFNKKVGRDQVSAMFHILRGIKFSRDILYKIKNFSLDLSQHKQVREFPFLQAEFKRLMGQNKDDLKTFRQTVLKVALEKKEIPRFLDIDTQIEINENLMTMVNICHIDLKESLLRKMFQCNEDVEFRYT